jgi:ABC-type branched-subunit amino acid transport system permease subunit
MNLAYIFLMMTLGINFFCFIYVTYIDRQKNGGKRAESPNRKRAIFKMSAKIWLPYLLLILLLMLFYLVFKN